jgi:alanine racemase
VNYTLQEIASICGGTISGSPSSDIKIKSIAWDSRQLIVGPDILFITISGKNHDAHDFIEKIEKQGVKNFLVNTSKFKRPQNSSANFILVEDSLEALQILAGKHRSRFNLPIVGITGSNGKTTIKEWLGELLSPHFSICKNPKSYNSKLGVPLSLLQIQQNHNIGIFETGISQPNEMKVLADLIQPDYALITNLGAAHDEGFNSRTEKLNEKLKLLRKSKTVFLVDNNDELSHRIKNELQDKQIIKLSLDSDAFIQTKKIQKENGYTNFCFWYRGIESKIILPFTDHASVNNMLYCILIYFHFRNEHPIKEVLIDLQKGLNNLRALKMRLEILDGSYNSSIINDTYTNDLDSFEVALQHLVRHNPKGTKILILSDLLQINSVEKDKLYTTVSERIVAAKIDHFIGIGTDIQMLKSPLKSANITSDFYSHKDIFKSQFNLRQIENASVLIKGARTYEFEELVDFLAEKNHRTYLEVNLNSIRNNLSYFRSKINKDCKLLAMVKAEAYGGGDHEIAKILEQEHIDYLGVAYVDEGVKLRKSGVQCPILVLNVGIHEFDQCIRYSLEPEIHSINQFIELSKIASDNIHPIKFHLKIETGMNRLGFKGQALDEFLEIYKPNKLLRLGSVFSHLASSESESEKAFTELQFKNFNQAVLKIQEKLNHNFDRHILNTAGINNYPEMQLEMVRLGIGLFGIGSKKVIQEQLNFVFRLKASVTAVHKVSQKDTIGYGRMGNVEEDSYIATISIGYADGLLRKAGNKAFEVKINNKLYPIIGNVCMDMCMVNLGRDTSVRAGDEVIIFECPDSLNRLTQALETIPYEVLTNISQRVRRKYIQD